MIKQFQKMKIDFNKDFSSFQDGARRMENAMNGTPDRVPVGAQMHEFVMKELDINAKKFYTTPKLLPYGTLEIMEKYGIDVPFLDYDVYNIEAEALGQKIKYSDFVMPDVDRTRPLIRDHSDLTKIKTPDFDSEGRFPNVIEMQSIFRKLTGATPALSFCAPFSLAANIRGIESLIMDIDSDPDFARSLFDRLTEDVLVPWVHYQKQKFPDTNGFVCNDATGSLPIVNLYILKEWIVPYILRLRELCGSEVYLPNWVGEKCLEKPEEMFALKLKVCPDFLEGQDPDVAEIGPEVYKSYAEKQGVPLILGIGASFMDLSTPEQVADRVKHYVKVGRSNGRFALFFCNLSAQTPSVNVRAAIEALHSHGTYSES